MYNFFRYFHPEGYETIECELVANLALGLTKIYRVNPKCSEVTAHRIVQYFTELLARRMRSYSSYVSRKILVYGDIYCKVKVIRNLLPRFVKNVWLLLQQPLRYTKKTLHSCRMLYIFTKEASFTSHHTPNKQNVRIWSQQNLHVVYPGNTQYPWKINQWAGILSQSLLGPVIIDRTITSEKYLQLLQYVISNLIADADVGSELWYQHDGCPAHNFDPAINSSSRFF